MRRIKFEKRKLHEQISSCANGIGGEPAWPAGAPTQVEVQTLADELDALIEQVRAAEQALQELRFSLRKKGEEATQMVRRIDNITSGLYGIDGSQKISFGLRPIDTTRNSAGQTPKVQKLVLSDGLAAGSVQADWKSIPRAIYEVQWFADVGMGLLLGSAVASRSELLIPGLAPGTQIWVRVRALRSKRHGEWSDAATRIANV